LRHTGDCIQEHAATFIVEIFYGQGVQVIPVTKGELIKFIPTILQAGSEKSYSLYGVHVAENRVAAERPAYL
jgi:hypothetical protein